MNKAEIIKLIIEHQTELVKELNLSIEGLEGDRDIDEDAVKDSEDFSHQTEAGEMEGRMKEQLKAATLDLSLVKNVSEGTFDTAQVGALVETDKNNFFICIPSVPVEVGGKSVIGISNRAPIFFKMNNKKVGDSFEVANIEYKIIAIS